MNTRHVAALASGFVLSVSAAAADPPAPLAPEATTVLNIRLSAAVLATFAERGGKFSPPFPQVVSLDSMGSTLGAELRRDLAPRDGWGHAIKILVADPKSYSLISFGADGSPDASYGKVRQPQQTRNDAPPDPASRDRDFIFAGGRFVQRPHAAAPASKRALADLRSIGTAIESFGVDNDDYPGPTGGLQPIDTMAAGLEPEYIKTLPRVDPWGRPYLVSSDGASYLLVSAGADGLLDAPYSDPEDTLKTLGRAQANADDDGDIVFADGQFLRWPPGASAEDTPADDADQVDCGAVVP
jgi:hypothetical protein